MYFIRSKLIHYSDGYRQDCSGMVSMAWKSSTSGGGHTTYNMQVEYREKTSIACLHFCNILCRLKTSWHVFPPQANAKKMCFCVLNSFFSSFLSQNICTRIDRSQLQKGDAILQPSDHVLLFDHWVDSDHFMEYAEHDYGQVASHDQTSYSYYANQGFFPCRYNEVA